MITVKIPYEFLRQRVNLSWSDVKFGLDQQLIAPTVAIHKAKDRLCERDDVCDDEIELASRSESEPVLELVLSLANAENSASDENVRAKWLYLVLAWLFENRRTISDPLGMVEEVYSDFGYPREVVSFIRYMPMVGPDLGSREQNEARLYDYWADYLAEAGKRFARSTGASE